MPVGTGYTIVLADPNNVTNSYHNAPVSRNPIQRMCGRCVWRAGIALDADGQRVERLDPPSRKVNEKTTPPNPENEKQERNGKTGTRRKNKSPSPAPDATPDVACAFLLLRLARLVSSTAPPAYTPPDHVPPHPYVQYCVLRSRRSQTANLAVTQDTTARPD
ncbi:hypothetical protein C8R45DRAFT_1102227 [Mycena sanguinolenta]|nr:hypothetical protein C8R45DRAFT_1102227 [Mycena sanguinolenta]